MNKKIKILAIIFSILVLVVLILLLFLKIDNFVTTNIIKENNNSFIILKNDDYKKIKDKDKITFILNENKLTKNVNEVFNYNNYTFLQLNQIFTKNDFETISVFIQSKTLFCF